MIRCGFCGHNFHEPSVRRIPTSERHDTDPAPSPAGRAVYICGPCDRKRERLVRLLETNRRRYASLRAVA